MNEYELMLCRLTTGESLTSAMLAEGVTAEYLAKWLANASNKRKFNIVVAMGRETLAERAKATRSS